MMNKFKISSFRLRIAFLSASLASISVVFFGVFSWYLTYNAKLSRLDALLANVLTMPLLHNIAGLNQIYLDNAIKTELDLPVYLFAINPDRQIIYKSPNWPANLQIDQLWQSFPKLHHPAPPFLTGTDTPSNQSEKIPPIPIFYTKQTGSVAWRIGLIVFPDIQIATILNLQVVNEELSVIKNIFLISIPLTLFFVASGAWILSGKALSPIRDLITTIEKVNVTGLAQKIPPNQSNIEFSKLIEVFNQMLERLDRSFKQAIRFSGDAAHELKTPLTILQGEVERALIQVEMGSEIQQRFSTLLDEIQRLNSIVHKLLFLSLADAEQINLQRENIDVSSLLLYILEDIQTLAPHLETEIKISPNLKLQGDCDLLTQVIQNLLSNAIKYNLSKGWIKIIAYEDKKDILINIVNASENILENEKELIFERFYRRDICHCREIEGTGLGLSIAKEITLAHGGQLTLDNSVSNQTSFLLRLPKEEDF